MTWLGRLLLVSVTVWVATGCLPKHPTRTARPEVDISPWEDKTATSKTTGERYSYMFLAGPSDHAPQMLLLHGGFFDNRIWLNMRGLAEHFNLYALLWPNASGLYTGNLSDYAAITADFLDALGIDQVYLTGVSAGAYAAIETAATADPKRIKALVLFSANMIGIDKREVRNRTQLSRFVLAMKPERFRALVESRATKTEYNAAPGDLQQADLFYVRPYEYYKRLFQAMLNQGKKRQDTGKIACPTLVLHGTGDRIMPIKRARKTPDVIKGAEYLEFKDLKHSMVFTEGPTFVDPIVDFLKTRAPWSPNLAVK